jgi:hypothetical protein
MFIILASCIYYFLSDLNISIVDDQSKSINLAETKPLEVQPTEIKDSETEKSDLDYTNYIGTWIESDETNRSEEILYSGGSIMEIKEVKSDFIKGSITEISAPPSNRIASIDFEGKVIDSEISVKFEDDGFYNSGKARIVFKDNRIDFFVDEIQISDENTTGWSLGNAVLTKENN